MKLSGNLGDTLCKKRPYSELFWSIFLLIRTLRIQSECGKIRTRITPNTNTLHAVAEVNQSFNFHYMAAYLYLKFAHFYDVVGWPITKILLFGKIKTFIMNNLIINNNGFTLFSRMKHTQNNVCFSVRLLRDYYGICPHLTSPHLSKWKPILCKQKIFRGLKKLVIILATPLKCF